MAGVCTTRAEWLVEDKWADLGPGPALISAFGAEVLLAISDSEPAPAAIGFMLRYDHRPCRSRPHHGYGRERVLADALGRSSLRSICSAASSPSSRNFK